MGIVYLITNKVNGKVYVGMTTRTFVQRYVRGEWWVYTVNEHLKRAAEKYGKDNFEVTTVAKSSSCEELFKIENEWIVRLKSCLPERGYNKACSDPSQMTEEDEERYRQIRTRKGREWHSIPENKEFIRKLLAKNRDNPNWKKSVKEGIAKYHTENKEEFAVRNKRAWSEDRRAKARERMNERAKDESYVTSQRAKRLEYLSNPENKKQAVNQMKTPAAMEKWKKSHTDCLKKRNSDRSFQEMANARSTAVIRENARRRRCGLGNMTKEERVDFLSTFSVTAQR